MASFRDQALLELADPTRLAGHLADPPNQDRLTLMLTSSYELQYARIQSVGTVTVPGLELQKPLFPGSHTTGTFCQTVPSLSHNDIGWDTVGDILPVWVDVLATLRIAVVAEIDPGELDTVLFTALREFHSLDEFRNQFQFIDLDAFMAEHHLTDVDELREAFSYLRGEIQLKALAPFDANDPANAYQVDLVAALLVSDTVDLTAVLRAARLVLAAGRDAATPPAPGLFGELLIPYAPVAVLPQDAPAAAGLSAADVVALLAGAGVATVFLSQA